MDRVYAQIVNGQLVSSSCGNGEFNDYGKILVGLQARENVYIAQLTFSSGRFLIDDQIKVGSHGISRVELQKMLDRLT